VKHEDPGELKSARFPLDDIEDRSFLPVPACASKRWPNTEIFEKAWGRRKGRSVFLRRKRGQQKMPLLQILIVLVVVGVLLWLVNNFIPMQSTIKSILNGIVVIATVLWLLNVFGVLHSLSRIHVGT
jgi:hypothetical protein